MDAAAAATGPVLALGYEGPLTVGDLIGAALLVVGSILITALVIRWLVTVSADDREPKSARHR